MIESSPQISGTPIHDSEHVEHKTSGAGFGIRAACFILFLATLVLASMVYQETAAVTDTRKQLAQATNEGTQTKADLDKANIKVVDMQNQMTAAVAKSADLQTQLTHAQGQNSGLQAQVAKAQSQSSDMKAQMDTANERLSEAQAQISLSSDSAAMLRKQLDAAKAQIADLQSQAAKGDSVAAQAPAPLAAMPVAATFEKSFWSGKYTLHVRNSNTDPLNVIITIAGSPVRAPITATIKGGSIYDITDLTDGAGVAITSAGYSPVSLTVH
jgi:hypothetical protein